MHRPNSQQGSWPRRNSRILIGDSRQKCRHVSLNRRLTRGSKVSRGLLRGSGPGVTSCAGVRRGPAFGGGDVSVHRCRGFDPSVGGRRGCDAGGAGRPRRGVAHGDRGARRAACSSTPVTGCAPRSPRRGQRWMRRWLRSGQLELPVRMGHGDRRGRAARRGLLRCGAQPCRAGDGRRARRSDPAGRVDGGSAQRSRPGRSGAATVAGCADAGRGVSGPSGGPADGVSAAAGAGYDVRGICGLRPPA